jgi:hypothetical protein
METTDFSKLRAYCIEKSGLSSKVIDQFLVDLAARKNNNEVQMIRELKPFTSIVKKWDEEVVPYFMGEYLILQILKKDGLIHSYLNHASVLKRPAAEQELLHLLAKEPAVFSFFTILSNPSPDFFTALDLFTAEEFLFYSPTTQKTPEEERKAMWFTLRASIGPCWLFYGINISLPGLTPDDIYFYATEIDAAVETNEDIMAQVHHKPFHYFMLFDLNYYPALSIQHQHMRFVTADDVTELPPEEELQRYFDIEKREKIIRMILFDEEKEDGGRPVVGEAYYNLQSGELHRSAFSLSHFEVLTEELKKAGFDIPDEPTVSVAPQMLSFAAEVLKRQITFNPYGDLFDDDDELDEEGELFMAKMNALTDELAVLINQHITPDLDALADEFELPRDTARHLYNAMTSSLKR